MFDDADPVVRRLPDDRVVRRRVWPGDARSAPAALLALARDLGDGWATNSGTVKRRCELDPIHLGLRFPPLPWLVRARVRLLRGTAPACV